MKSERNYNVPYCLISDRLLRRCVGCLRCVGRHQVLVLDSLPLVIRSRWHEPGDFIIWIRQRLFSRRTGGAALFVNRINTDRRSGLCGTHWEARAMAFPVYRAERARRDFTQSLDGRIWWLTLARLGCSTRTRRESSRPRHWAYLRRRSTVSLRRPIRAIPTASQAGRRLGETGLRAARELCPDWTTLRALRRSLRSLARSEGGSFAMRQT